MWQKLSTAFLLSVCLLVTGCIKQLITNPVSWINNSPSAAKIALLLPLEGPLATKANAIRNGFFAAYYQSTKNLKTIPTILIFNTAHKNIKIVYHEAIQKGANIIVGPLTKKNIAVLVSTPLSVPILALNTIVNGSNPYIFQYGLSPLDEAIQAAPRIWNDQHSHILMIIPQGSWGQEIAKAFQIKWESLGGKITAQLIYTSNGDLNDEIRHFLNIDKSEMRAQHLKQILDEKIRFIPRRREDFDAIFIVANSNQARQIIPLLRFYYIGDIPIYATSAIYSPNVIIDHDLDGVIFDDMPWVLAPEKLSLLLQQTQKQIRTLWPNSYDQNIRLYGLGVDAYQILTKLAEMALFSQYHVNGATGILYLLPNQKVYRQLLWAKINNGQAHLVK